MHQYRFVDLIKVSDGDTIDCRIALREVRVSIGFGLKLEHTITGAFRFRVSNIDTPEISGRDATPAGKAAKLFTEAWFHGKRGKLVARTEKGSDATVGVGDGAFGRWLADFLEPGNGESLSEALTAAGYARHDGNLYYVPQ